ncbi:MAG: hypothetical protein E7559_03165 [Ruminococcaceae bacterium]|nr:hypothetical protein [Oscillospiraceae bacterium]
MKKLSVILLFLTLLLAFPAAASAEGDEAVNIAKQCTFSSADNEENFNLLTDKGYFTELLMRKNNDYWQIDFGGNDVQGMYILWRVAPGAWQLAVDSGSGFNDYIDCAGEYIQEYVPIPSGVRAVRMLRPTETGDRLQVYSLEIYTPGRLPETVHLWEPTPNTAELMLLSAHQDDELLYLGGSIPYYAGEKKLDTVVVYAATCSQLRLHESLNGIWTCGMRTYPVFLGLPDYKSFSIDEAKKYWSTTNTRLMLTEQLLKYRPQVVVTQDENGEYGHGAHRLMVALLKDAIVNSADAEYVAEKFPQYKPWEIKKCYLHLYKKNKVVIPWDEMYMDSFGGMSAHKVACLGYEQHKSQHQWYYKVALNGAEDCRKFGLYHSTVGEDVAKNDFFENITLRIYDKAPDASVIMEGMTQYGHNPAMYSTIDAAGQPMWLRYGEIDGVTAWYAVDSTGTLLEPLRTAFCFEDAQPEDIEAYEPLPLCSSSDIPIYEYSANSGDVQLLRCAATEEGPVWYVVDDNGMLCEPRVTVTVPKRVIPPPPEPAYSLSDYLLLSVLGVLFLSLIATLIIPLIRKKFTSR